MFEARGRPAAEPRREAGGEGGVRKLNVYLLMFGWTLFSVFLYSRFSTLGDSHGYMTGAFDDEHAARTLMIMHIAETVMGIVHSELLAHMAFAGFSATGVVFLIKHAKPRGRYRWPLLAILLTPNFGVWASVSGRESMFIGLCGLFMGSVLGYWRKPSLHLALLALICCAGMIFIRSPYGIGMSLFWLMFLAYRSGPRIGFTLGVQAVLFVAAGALVVSLGWPFLDAYISGDVLPTAVGYFSLGSDNTRTWIHLDTTWEFLASLWWSLPLALVGPTPAEVLARPVMFPFFLSGLVIMGSFLNSILVAFRAPRGLVRKILLLGWLPAMLMIVIAYVPFGIYNSGSAIRYASCFLLFLAFPSMMMSALAADARDEEGQLPPLWQDHAFGDDEVLQAGRHPLELNEGKAW
jgi:hypothetical protein